MTRRVLHAVPARRLSALSVASLLLSALFAGWLFPSMASAAVVETGVVSKSASVYVDLAAGDTVTANLNWSHRRADVQLRLRRSDDALVAAHHGASKPKTITYTAAITGRYRWHLTTKTRTPYTLRWSVASDVATAPRVDAPPSAPVDAPTKQSVINGAGPRYALIGTLSSGDAKARLVSTGVLERVRVKGGLDLSDVDRGYTIRDVEIDAAGSRYGIRTKVGYAGVTRPTGRQLIEHVEVHGAMSAGLYLRDVTVRHADVWGNIDNVKSADRVELYASWLHDQAWVSEAHADAIQIQYGVDQLFHWNVIDARYGDASVAGARAGTNANAALQMGSMTGSASARLHHNWWTGGHYTVRLGNSGPPLIDFSYRDNWFGRAFTYGPVHGTKDHSTSYGGARFDASNRWEDTGAPV